MHSILVVDDEPNYLVVLSELLRDEGFEVFTAPAGEDALAIVKEDARNGRDGTAWRDQKP